MQTVEQRAEYVKALIVEKGYAEVRGDTAKVKAVEAELRRVQAQGSPTAGAVKRPAKRAVKRG